MPRPTTQIELIAAANGQWDKLWALIDSLPDPQAVVFDFGDDPKLKEAHWQRDKTCAMSLSTSSNGTNCS
jgi:Uncharacterized conserved protein